MGKTVIQKDLSYLEKYFGDKYQRRFISPQDGAALYSLSYTAFRKLANICFSKVPQDIRNNLQGLRGRVRKAFDDIAGDDFFYGRERKPVIRFEHSEENYNLDLGILIRNNNGQYCRIVIDDVWIHFS